MLPLNSFSPPAIGRPPSFITKFNFIKFHGFSHWHLIVKLYHNQKLWIWQHEKILKHHKSIMYVLMPHELRMSELSSFSSNLILAHNCNVSLYVLVVLSLCFQVNTHNSGFSFCFRLVVYSNQTLQIRGLVCQWSYKYRYMGNTSLWRLMNFNWGLKLCKFYWAYPFLAFLSTVLSG